MSEDHLAGLSDRQVADWYGRLARRTYREKIGGRAPLAALFLHHYLENRDPNSTHRFTSPHYLRQSQQVLDGLKFHRRVFLTEEKARFTGKPTAWAGILPRLKGSPGFTKWDLSAPLELNYESLVEVGSNAADIARIQLRGEDAERDLFTSLRGFQLVSHVTLKGEPLPSPKFIKIEFTAWECFVKDRYDFDGVEHLTLPNPDYQSGTADAVRPEDKEIKVFHKNAQRMEKAGLAAPFNVESEKWNVRDQRINGPVEIDPAREY